MRVLEQDFEIDAFLERPLFAHLATVSDEGPCESPLWFLWEENALWFIADNHSSYAKRLERDPCVARRSSFLWIRNGFGDSSSAIWDRNRNGTPGSGNT